MGWQPSGKKNLQSNSQKRQAESKRNTPKNKHRTPQSSHSEVSSLKTWVFSCFLKASPETADHIAIGRVFQRIGAIVSEAQLPFVFSLEHRTTIRSLSEDLLVI